MFSTISAVQKAHRDISRKKMLELALNYSQWLKKKVHGNTLIPKVHLHLWCMSSLNFSLFKNYQFDALKRQKF